MTRNRLTDDKDKSVNGTYFELDRPLALSLRKAETSTLTELFAVNYFVFDPRNSGIKTVQLLDFIENNPYLDEILKQLTFSKVR